MTKKLHLIPTDPGATSAIPAPPRQLGVHGANLWAAVLVEHDISDSAGSEMLCQACQALDRAEELSEAIARDGAVVYTKAGGPKEHPGLKGELASRSFVVRTLHLLGLDSEPVRAMGRPPLGM